ncbi:MAG TPA: hypothetical protein VGF84_11435 [Micromonosporaceae bacterium]|jgi:hypothetical protein
MPRRAVLVLLAALAVAACSSRAPKPAASPTPDPGVAMCLPFSHYTDLGVTEGEIDAATEAFSASKYDDIREAGTTATAAYGSTATQDELDQDLINLWTACAAHGVKVAPAY